MKVISIPEQVAPAKVVSIGQIIVIPDQSRIIVQGSDASSFERPLTGVELASIINLVESTVQTTIPTATVGEAAE